MVELMWSEDTLFVPHFNIITNHASPTRFGCFINPCLGFGVQLVDVVKQVVHSGSSL